MWLLGNRMGPRFSGALEIIHMYASNGPDPYTPAALVGVSTISGVEMGEFTKIFCNCGRIVDIDTFTYRRRLQMHKNIECATCRNRRIAEEIEHLDEHYGFIEGEEVF